MPKARHALERGNDRAVQIPEGAPIPFSKHEIGNLHPEPPDERYQECDRKNDKQEVQVNLAGDQQRDDGKLPDQVQALPPVPDERKGGLELSAPAVRLPEPIVAQDEAAGIAQPHTCQQRGEAREPSQAHAPGENEDEAAEQPDEAVHREHQRIPKHADSSADCLVAGEILHDNENADDQCGEGEEPAGAAPVRVGLGTGEYYALLATVLAVAAPLQASVSCCSQALTRRNASWSTHPPAMAAS